MLDDEKLRVLTFDVAGLTDDLSAKLERHFDVLVKQGGQMVCSQYVFHQLKMIGLPPLLRCTEDFISPRDLLISPNLIA